MAVEGITRLVCGLPGRWKGTYQPLVCPRARLYKGCKDVRWDAKGKRREEEDEEKKEEGRRRETERDHNREAVARQRTTAS